MLKPRIFSRGATDKDIRSDIVKNPDKFLKEKFNGSRFAFGLDCLKGTGTYREMGIVYDFRDTLPKFLYLQHGTWHEMYAPNRAALRRHAFGRVHKIIPLED